MKLIRNFCFLVLATFLSISCGDDDTPGRPAELRIQNFSSVDMNNVVLTTNIATYNFNTVASFGVSDYQTVEGGFTSGNITLNAGGENLTVQAQGSNIDAGTFTYQLALDCSGGTCVLGAMLIED